MNKEELAGYLDFANHHAESTAAAIKELCQKVKEHGFHSAFVNPCFVASARAEMGAEGRVGTVVAFPLGQETTSVKLLAAQQAIRAGADELDVSMNIGWFKNGQTDQVLEEMKRIVLSVRQLKRESIIKFIIETGLLSIDEIQKAAKLVVDSGADFVKTSSGFGPRGAEIRDVELIKEAVGDRAKIKVAGGIDTYDGAIGFIIAGAHQIGTSHAMEIINGEKNESSSGVGE
jgi:deoxyribose-phosphate aldolase